MIDSPLISDEDVDYAKEVIRSLAGAEGSTPDFRKMLAMCYLLGLRDTKKRYGTFEEAVKLIESTEAYHYFGGVKLMEECAQWLREKRNK